MGLIGDQTRSDRHLGERPQDRERAQPTTGDCVQRGLDPVPTYAALAHQHGAPRPRGPFNLAARRAAGFDDDELAALATIAP